jgi:hypothetical protein
MAVHFSFCKTQIEHASPESLTLRYLGVPGSQIWIIIVHPRCDCMVVYHEADKTSPEHLLRQSQRASALQGTALILQGAKSLLVRFCYPVR